MPVVLYSAAIVCPMTGPPIPAGGVLVADGRIVAVGEAVSLQPRASRRHHVDGVLLPGLVDASTHLEHADLAGLARPGPPHAWARAVLGATAAWSQERWSRSARRGVQQALRAGTTTCVDVVTRGPAVPAAARAGLHGDSLVELGWVDVREQDDVLAAVGQALERPAGGRRVGIAALATTALGSGVLQAVWDLACTRGVPLQIPAATSSAEAVALRTGTGPFADLARERGLEAEWLDAPSDVGPIRYLEELGVLAPPTTVVGAARADARDVGRLAARAVPVVLRPRMDRALGAGAPPFDALLDAAIPLALGTGSPAAVGDVDVLAEAAAFARAAAAAGYSLWRCDDGPVGVEEAAVRLVTVDGARTLGWGRAAGVLEPGRRADLVGVEVPGVALGTVHADLLERGPGRQVLTVLGGVVRARRERATTPWPDVVEHKDLV